MELKKTSKNIIDIQDIKFFEFEQKESGKLQE